MPLLEFLDVTKTFPARITALDRFTLAIADGELVVIVGPSGAGKTTALRIVAGLERADSGSICMDGRAIDHLRPKDRDVAMVFQQPALYPHLNVRRNIEFSLRLRGAPRGEIEHRASQAASAVGISDLLDRRPDTLSGGQAQRVMLARALARRPKCLLLDEPFASLDAPLRLDIRQTFRAARRSDPVTTLFVTHDQEEAMSIADRLVVVRAGRIEQMGSPQQVYDMPANRFVAGFLGSPPMNFFDGRLIAAGDCLWFESSDLRLPVAEQMRRALSAYEQREVTLGIRPEHWMPTGEADALPQHTTQALIEQREFHGDRWSMRGRTPAGVQIAAVLARSAVAQPGEIIRLRVLPDRATYFAADSTGRNLTP